MKIRSHIVKDSETAIDKANKIYTELDNFIRHVYGKDDADCGDDLWDFYSRTTEDDFDEIEAWFSSDVTGIPEQTIDDIISVIDTIDNGSYGLLLSATDYGVSMYKCYGKAEFAEVTEDDVKGYTWGTDSYLCLDTSITVEKLAQILDCDTDSVCDEGEERGIEIANKLLPDFIKNLYEENKKDLPKFYDVKSAFSDRADVDEENGIVNIMLYFQFHDHTTEQLLAIKKAFDDGTLSGWTLQLSDVLSEDGKYENVMINSMNDSVVEFTTSDGCFENIRFMKMKI